MRASRIAFNFRARDTGGGATDLPRTDTAGMLRLPIEIRLHGTSAGSTARDVRDTAVSQQSPDPMLSGTPHRASAGFVPSGVRGQNHPDRDNNPLDMRSGATTRRFGAVADDSGFAVFTKASDGYAAASERFDRIGGTLNHIISVWSPAADDNDTANMQRQIPAAAGLSGETSWHDLSPDQKRDFLYAYARREGFHGDAPQM